MKVTLGAVTALLALVGFASSAQAQSELQNYVAECQRQLGFSAADIPAMNCNQGVQFANGGRTAVNDFLVHRRVNDNVDVLAACRWGDNNNATPLSVKFASLELLIHNRINQQTCFFSAKDRPSVTGDVQKPVTTAIISPTNYGPHPNADDFWLSPTELNNKTLLSNKTGHTDTTDPIRCTGCHVQGAIIASDSIVPFLARFGVINNRHETLVNMSAGQHYHAVGASGYQGKPVITAFKDWDATIAAKIEPGSTCASGCHVRGGRAPIGDLFPTFDGTTRLLQSITTDIATLSFCCMPPNQDDSNWRWINLNVPTGGVETENYADAKDPSVPAPIPALLDGCDNPANLEAHAVGTPIEFSTSSDQQDLIPDRLRAFNLREGLVCLNSDQEPGKSCHDYSTSYFCNGEWTDVTNGSWYNHAPAADGDHEERSRSAGLCANPLAIKLKVNTTNADIFGANDRLARLSRYGLTCKTSDQPNGAACSNYVVRYRGCGAGTLPYQGRIKSGWDGYMLTASGNADNAAAKGQPLNTSWNTQFWVLEPIARTEFFRLRNAGTNTYLNVTTQAESSPVVTYALHADWDSEKWTLEKTGTGGTRLKNVWSGKYLTLADTSTFSNLFSQGLNTTWASQLWAVQ